MNPAKDDRTTFYVFCDGDMSVGIPGSQAEVLVWVDDEMREFVRREIATTFEGIWDQKVRVLTSDECSDEGDQP